MENWYPWFGCIALSLTLLINAPGAAAREKGLAEESSAAAAVEAARAEEPAPLKHRVLPTKPDRAVAWAGLYTDRLVVKFKDGTRVRVVGGEAERDRPPAETEGDETVRQLYFSPSELTARDWSYLSRFKLKDSGVARDVSRVNEILREPRVRDWGPLFSGSSADFQYRRAAGEGRAGEELADLQNYYRILLQESADALALVDELNALAAVEIAYLPPRPEDADVPPPTPAFDAQQGYLGPAPGGIDTAFTRNLSGGRGAGINIIDVEQGWNLNHEDLPSTFVSDGIILGGDSRQHGTAVLGEIVGLDDGTGVVGIASDAAIGVVSVIRQRRFVVGWRDWDVAEALWVAGSHLRAGDIVLIEQHAPGRRTVQPVAVIVTSGAISPWSTGRRSTTPSAL